MSPAELLTAQAIVDALHTQITRQARRHGLAVADPRPLLGGHDVCGNQPAFYNADPTTAPAAWHPPNRYGQAPYAVASGRTWPTGQLPEHRRPPARSAAPARAA